jgi:uncharacterized protein YndB with AHSA1/START domain
VAPPYVIEYVGSFALPASPERVWSSLRRFDLYETWWPWLKDVRVDGPGLVSGSALDGTVVPPLPYRMHVHVTFVKCTAPRSIDAALVGDLRGQGRLRLTREADGTRADVTWTIEMMQSPMRLVSRVARPLLLWGQDRVVDSTLAGFSAHLRRTRGA